MAALVPRITQQRIYFVSAFKNDDSEVADYKAIAAITEEKAFNETNQLNVASFIFQHFQWRLQGIQLMNYCAITEVVDYVLLGKGSKCFNWCLRRHRRYRRLGSRPILFIRKKCGTSSFHRHQVDNETTALHPSESICFGHSSCPRPPNLV